ncbi:MAG: TIGR00282 family metallophosphoesterase [candidate division Zixibacteria bacterium]|nr:TIGR00282 family metallophosphoesterase [candidate division Zixibacteria bacterium]
MKVLIIGDIVGKIGRWAVSQVLPDFIEEKAIDFVIANVENAAGGFGITENISKKIRSYGVNVQTSGNHIWDRPEVKTLLDKSPYLLRPANYPMGSAGKGSGVYTLADGRKIGVLNLEGRDFLSRIDCPFRVADAELTLLMRETRIIIVDFHAETPQEKQALAFYLDGRISAQFGTHTHVQTADEKILPKGTAYITDVGMTGAYDSILGMSKKIALGRFITGIPLKFSVADGDVRIGGVIFDIDDETGKTVAVERVMESVVSGNYDQ